MGLIKAIAGAAGGALGDQWREYFYCDALPSSILVTKGKKRTSGRSSNTKGEDNIISNGSIVAVNKGQAMIIVDNGKVVDICGEEGEFVYDTSTEPSIFYGGLGKGILDTFKTIGKRFTFGGDTGKDQRVYFFNTKHIDGNLYGTQNPVPFRVVDQRIGLDFDIDVRCNGEYVYQIDNPLLFYTNVCGNVEEDYTRAMLEKTLRMELLTALQPALGKISAKGVRYSEIPNYTTDIRDALKEELTAQWTELRGISIVSFGVNSVVISDEDKQKINKAQEASIYMNPMMAGGMLSSAQADAMKTAAGNSAGAMTGFMGMGFAQNAGGMNAANLFSVGQQMQQQQQAAPAAPAAAPAADGWTCKCGATNTGKFCVECGTPKPAPAGSWTCKCGASNNGKFCVECGSPKPADTQGWTCQCGAVNQGKFCVECGAKKPAGAPLYRCDKCGWVPADPMNPPKFCPECADPFDDSDIQ